MLKNKKRVETVNKIPKILFDYFDEKISLNRRVCDAMTNSSHHLHKNNRERRAKIDVSITGFKHVGMKWNFRIRNDRMNATQLEGERRRSKNSFFCDFTAFARERRGEPEF